MVCHLHLRSSLQPAARPAWTSRSPPSPPPRNHSPAYPRSWPECQPFPPLASSWGGRRKARGSRSKPDKPRLLREHGLEVRGSSEHISGHGDAEGQADVVRMTHGFEESWVDVLQNPKAEERDNSRLICGLVGAWLYSSLQERHKKQGLAWFCLNVCRKSWGVIGRRKYRKNHYYWNQGCYCKLRPWKHFHYLK